MKYTFSEPNDPVFWIDYMTKKAFEEGFGLQTPMITGQLHVPRYYPYFKKAFNAIKGLIDQQCPLTDELRERSIVNDIVSSYDKRNRKYLRGATSQ